MKKLLIILPIIFILTACSRSVEVNNNSFVKMINDEFDYEIIESIDSVSKTQNDIMITYYFPKNFDITITAFSDIKTGTIIKYTLTGYESDKNFNSFSERFYNAISENNEHISIDSQSVDNSLIFVYEDLRYKTENENPTLKN